MNTKYSNKYGNLIVPDLIGSVLNVPFDGMPENSNDEILSINYVALSRSRSLPRVIIHV